MNKSEVGICCWCNWSLNWRQLTHNTSRVCFGATQRKDVHADNWHIIWIGPIVQCVKELSGWLVNNTYCHWLIDWSPPSSVGIASHRTAVWHILTQLTIRYRRKKRRVWKPVFLDEYSIDEINIWKIFPRSLNSNGPINPVSFTWSWVWSSSVYFYTD